MANIEQATTFALISFVTIVFTSMIAYSTVYGRPDVPQTVDFIRLQGEQMQLQVGAWFGLLYWIIGALSLFAAALWQLQLRFVSRHNCRSSELPSC
ncbi:MAG: Nramp family divalent metal transporter [Nitrospira sp.]|nr:Nramp family divalent metal transporter [Nitrospira sp.]